MNCRAIQFSLLAILLIPCWIIASHYDIDLVNLYAAVGFAHTDLSRVYAQNGALGRYFYPPFSLVLFYPLGAFSFLTVKWFWISLQTVAYCFFWYGLYRLYPKLREPNFFWGWVIVFIVSINPIHNNYQSNNIQLMLMAMLVMAEVLSQRQNVSQFTAGMLVAFASWIKVFPAFIAVYYIMAKPWKVKWGVITGFLIGLLLPLVVFGTEGGSSLYRNFYFAVTTYSNENSLIKTPDIMCLPSLVERILTAASFSIGAIAITSKSLTLIISGLFFGFIFLSRRSDLNIWALALALTVFLNPSTRPHYFIFYVPAFVSLLSIVWQRKVSIAMWAILVAVGLVAFTTDAVVGKNLNDRLEYLSLPTIGSAIVALLLASFVIQKNKNTEEISRF